MGLLNILTAIPLLQGVVVAEIGLTAQSFQLVGGFNVDNVKLSWTSSPGAITYTVQRKFGFQKYTTIAQLPGTTFDDYGVPAGQVTYQVTASGGVSDSSREVTVTSGPSNSQGWLTYDNTHGSILRTKSNIRLGSTYFQYVVENDQNGMKQIVEMYSSNGYDFSGRTVVLTRNKVCFGTADGFCKLERVSFNQNPRTSEVVMWAHWENRQDYSQGRVAVAYGRPGRSPWTFGGSFQPLGRDSRDMIFFGDDDGSGYLLCSTSKNSDMSLFALTPDWHSVTSLVSVLLKGEHREAPSMLRHENIYYLFTSRASGWYPSAGQYISAPTLRGPWSPSRNIGNLAGFGGQSGLVKKLGSTWVMRADRWSANWIDKEPPNRSIVLPISLRDGFAEYHFYSTVRYLDDDTRGGAYGVQNGKIASLGKMSASRATMSGHVGSQATDGIQTDPNNYYESSAVPFTYDLDLGAPVKITQIDLTTRLVPGSETAYQYKIETAVNPTGPWRVLVDHSTNTAVGFVSDQVNDAGRYRYVRLDVQRILNVYNKHEADWARGVVELKVYAL